MATKNFWAATMALLVFAGAAFSTAALAFGEDKEPYDPGKEITDNPHGPGTHGPNPNGPDPHDEIHDRNSPLRDIERYGKELH